MLALARELMTLFADVCERVEIAGSIRRKKVMCSDIELVIIPKIRHGGLFEETTAGSGINLQFERVRELVASGVLADRLDKNDRPARGERFQRMLFKGIPVDLFCVLPPAQWGVVFMIRTGPAEFNKRVVTPWAEGGKVLSAGLSFSEGQLIDRKRPVSTPEEIDVFRAIGLKWIEPEDRDQAVGVCA
jgi:DNA polymerase/3'-5' exonuclease PolX